MKKAVVIFDNGGRSADRYTAVDCKTGDVVSFNERPFHPTYGFGQFCGNVTDRMNITFGYGWRNHFEEKKVLKQELKHYLNEARSNVDWLGREIKLLDLSEDAQRYLKQVILDSN